MPRKYYSQRNNGSKGKERISLDILKKFFEVIYREFHKNKYFCEKLNLGCCVDQQDENISSLLLKKLRKELWPICEEYQKEGKLKEYTKNDLFDMIEFLFDSCSKPMQTEGAYYHSWGDCGYHYEKFSDEDGRKEFRCEINEFLGDFENGYELSEEGEILHKADNGLDRLLKAEKVEHPKGDIKNRMIQAEELFYSGRSSILDRKNAVKELADCFEFLREEVRGVLNNKDEADLFNIANNFSIRHHNEKQKTDYDQNIWLSWMFHFYLATLHASLRLIKKQEEKK